MEYVFVKDSAGFVSKKLESEITPNEKIISEKTYLKLSGLKSYEKKFSHGGARENAGRKQKFHLPYSYKFFSVSKTVSSSFISLMYFE